MREAVSYGSLQQKLPSPQGRRWIPIRHNQSLIYGRVSGLGEIDMNITLHIVKTLEGGALQTD